MTPGIKQTTFVVEKPFCELSNSFVEMYYSLSSKQ